MRLTRDVIRLAAIVALVAGVVAPATVAFPQARPASVQAAPDFRLPLLAGGAVSLGDFKGKPAILLFWTPW